MTRGQNALAMAGEQAWFSIEQMIQLLHARVSVETLLRMIEKRLGSQQEASKPASSSRKVK